jgi:hypothetical protein
VVHVHELHVHDRRTVKPRFYVLFYVLPELLTDLGPQARPQMSLTDVVQ